MTVADRSARRLAWWTWLGVLLVTTLVLLAFRERLDKAHVALAYLLVVLGGSSAGGRLLGITLAGLAFLGFNFLFLPPYYTLVIADPLDWLVLLAFLVTSVVAAQLLTRAQDREALARARADEVGRLAALGAESLSAGRAVDALARVAEVIRSALALDRCDILVAADRMPDGALTAAYAPLRVAAAAGTPDGRPPDVSTGPESLANWVLQHGLPAAERGDGTTWIGSAERPGDPARWLSDDADAGTLLLPLRVHDRTVGVLRIGADEAFRLEPAQRQFLAALSYYAALGVERVRLGAEAERVEAYRQADALKTALLTGVSHDLRTPLTTIKALATRLREGGAGSGDAASIEEEADRLNRMVSNLLDLSRLNAGAVRMNLELNTVEDLVGAALRQAAGVLGTRRVTVTNAAPPDGNPQVGRFDFVQSLRALVNLLENAAKYGSANDPVDVSVSRRGAFIEVEVADRGPGVPDEERQRIFEPFYRAPGAPPDVGGAGLGLAIASRIAVEQGGSVHYAPRSGGGSVFTLVLPASNAEAPSVRADHPRIGN